MTNQTLATALDRAGIRMTDARRVVADLVSEQSGHFTAGHLLDVAHSRRLRIGRASVFRTLDLLAELNLIERLDLPSGDHVYVACDLAHHHHVVCSRCRRAVEVDMPASAPSCAGFSANGLRHRRSPPRGIRGLPRVSPPAPGLKARVRQERRGRWSRGHENQI